MFDVDGFRNKFPGLQVDIDKQPLIYFDNAASSLKHQSVIERLQEYQKSEASNVHRGAHRLANAGTASYEKARSQVQKFVGASSKDEIVFTRGTTEGINLVAQSFVGETLQEGDEILISCFEHHSNIVPWQALCRKKNLTLKVVPFSAELGFSLESFKAEFSDKTKFVSMLWYSNAFGQRFPIEEIISLSHQQGARVLIDGAQAPLHEVIDVQALDLDFLVFSGHKMFAPYGIGALFAKKDLLEAMEPYQYGGSMIDRVSFDGTTYADGPQKFEAGTPNISGAIGIGLSCEIIAEMGVENWKPHLNDLRAQVVSFLSEHSEYTVYDFKGTSMTPVISFNHQSAHPSDVGTLLDKYGIAVRAGHHCTQPLMERLKVPGTVRVSLAPYNTKQEVDFLCKTLNDLTEFF